MVQIKFFLAMLAAIFTLPLYAANVASPTPVTPPGAAGKFTAVTTSPATEPAATPPASTSTNSAPAANTPATSAAPAANTAPAANAAPATNTTPAANTAPATNAAPAANTAPATNTTPAANTAPATNAAPAANTTPATTAPASNTAPAAGAGATDVNVGENNSSTPIAQVIWVKGKVQATAGTIVRQLERRSSIFTGDLISTDQTGSGEIAFTDSSVVSLSSSTEFKIDSYNHKAGGPPEEEKSVMSLVKGGFRSITGAIPKAHPDGYQVNTPVATIGVRGTDYSAYFDATNGLIAKINQGAIYIQNSYGNIELNAALQQIYSTVPTNAAPRLMQKAPAVFTNQPPITPVAATTIQSITTPTATPGTPNKTIPAGGKLPPPEPKTISNFCIGLLQDMYQKVNSFFTRYLVA